MGNIGWTGIIIIAIFVESDRLICPAPIPRVCLLFTNTIALDLTCFATL